MERVGTTSVVGRLMILTFILGAIDVVLTLNSYLDYRGEVIFVGIVCTALTITSCFLVAALFRGVLESFTAKRVNYVYHSLMGLILIVGSALMAYQVKLHYPMKQADTKDEGKYVERIIAVALGFLNGLLYGCISIVIRRG